MDDRENIVDTEPDIPVADDREEYQETVPEDKEEEVAPSKRKTLSLNRSNHRNKLRLEQLNYERGLLEQQNVYKDSLLAEQQRQLQELTTQLQQKDKLSNDYFETAIHERESALVKEIKRAKEEGDIDIEIKLIEELADIKAKKNTNALLQFQRQEQQTQRVHNIANEDYVPIETSIPARSEPDLPEEFQEWLDVNPWYSNSSRLRQEADMLAQDLSDHLAFNNQEHLIGTSEFFNSISNMMNSRYGKEETARPSQVYEEDRPSSNYTNNVGPVSRRGISMADQYVQNRSVSSDNQPLRSLTKEEYLIARHMPLKKGQTEADIVKEYARAKNYPKSPIPGGTPDRLTIL